MDIHKIFTILKNFFHFKNYYLGTQNRSLFILLCYEYLLSITYVSSSSLTLIVTLCPPPPPSEPHFVHNPPHRTPSIAPHHLLLFSAHALTSSSCMLAKGFVVTVFTSNDWVFKYEFVILFQNTKFSKVHSDLTISTFATVRSRCPCQLKFLPHRNGLKSQVNFKKRKSPTTSARVRYRGSTTSCWPLIVTSQYSFLWL